MKCRIENFECVEFMQKHIANRAVDMVVTSPPYDNLRDYNGFTFDENAVIENLFRVVKIGGVVAWVVQDATVKGSKTGTSFRQALKFKEVGFNIHDVMIWKKPTFSAVGALKTRYAPVFEYIFIFSKGAPRTFNPIKDRPNKSAGVFRMSPSIRKADGIIRKNKSCTIAEFGQRFNVWEMSTVNQSGEKKHPAPFPVNLAADLIVSWTNPDDLIFDPFTGSGSSAIAAMQTGRHFIGCDISCNYVNMAKSRVDKFLSPQSDKLRFG